MLGAVAILTGLVLVLLELRQGQEVAGAQLLSERFSIIANQYNSIIGENAADVIAKACDSPDELTRQELVVMNAYFNSQFLIIRRMKLLSQGSDFSGSEQHWESWANGYFNIIIGQPYGRYWWGQVRGYWIGIFPEVVKIGDDVLAKAGDTYLCRSFYTDWQQDA